MLNTSHSYCISMKEQVTIWIDSELLQKVREYAEKETESKKALSGTITKILRERIEQSKETPPTNSNNTHTHETKKGITDIIEWIDQHNPSGISKREIERAIRETKGMDMRTINKYMPEVIREISNKGYKAHPKNNNLYIRYDIPLNPE